MKMIRFNNKKRVVATITCVSVMMLMWFNVNMNLWKYSNDRSLTSSSYSSSVSRSLSTDLGEGNCEWTEAEPLGKDTSAYGTLLASYPASGMRITWQHTEGITGIKVGDDFALGGDGVNDKRGILKTQYPHLEGIWSWGNQLNQVILLIRNPRYAIPSYHNLIHEIGYAHDWEAAYEGLFDTFTERAPMENWIQWRDYRIHDELKLWSWHIDFWMEGGTQYWTPYDFERNGQWPFAFLDETTQETWPKDPHCILDNMDCVAKTVISYERLVNTTSGPTELKKIANVIRDKEGMDNVVSDQTVSCIYQETLTNKQGPDNKDRNGPQPHDYHFSNAQAQAMRARVDNVRHKYHLPPWDTNPVAVDLVSILDEYLIDIDEYLIELTANPQASNAMTDEYKEELVQWYRSLGRGSRYNKAKVQSMPWMWRQIKGLYDSGEEEDTTVYLN